MNASGLRFAWVLNLDAELELATPGYQARSRLLRQLAEFGAQSRALLGPRDWLIDPLAPARSNAEEGWIGRAWCPTPRALELLAAAGVTPEPHPDTSVLRRVNHRRFACELGGGLPTQRYCETRAELEVHLDYVPGPWLLKRPLAFAGRGQLRVYREQLDEAQSAWVEASLRTDGLVVEPLVTPELELSIHGFVSVAGAFELGVPCVQEVSERGVFRAIRRARDTELSSSEARALFQQAERVALALAQAGYFGPFGVDAHRYYSAQGSGFCALSEINARYTMGFLTGFPRHPSELWL